MASKSKYQWLPTENWLISGNLAWLDAKYDEYMFKGVNIADQQEFTNAPDFSGALNVEYRTAAGQRRQSVAPRRLQLPERSGGHHRGDRGSGDQRVVEPITQDGYGLVNAGVIWKTGGAWTFSLQGSNLADKEYPAPPATSSRRWACAPVSTARRASTR